MSSFSSVTFPIKGPIVLIRHIHKTIVRVYDWKETKIFYLILHLCAWATCIWFSSFLYMNYHEYIYNKNLFLNGPKETSLFYQIMNSSSITSVFFQNNFQWKQLISHIKTKLIWLTRKYHSRKCKILTYMLLCLGLNKIFGRAKWYYLYFWLRVWVIFSCHIVPYLIINHFLFKIFFVFCGCFFGENIIILGNMMRFMKCTFNGIGNS